MNQRQRKYSRRKRHLDRYKKKVGCKICGFNDTRALQFDHIEPLHNKKARRIGQYIQCASLKTLFSELRKCRVLCANCHSIESQESFRRPNKIESMEQ